MDVSLCIVNYRATEFLLRCLRSISKAPPRSSLQIIVVDNASPDFDREAVLAEMKEAAIIENESNLGFAAASNQAIELARSEFALMCNPDIEFEPGTIDTLRDFMVKNPKAAGAAPQLIYPSGQVQRSCRGFPSPAGLLFEITGLARAFPQNERISSYRMRYFDHAATREVQQPMASCLMLRKEALRDVGPFDEEFPIYFNDVDWAMRAAKRGWKMFFVSGARAIHHHGQSTKYLGGRRATESTGSLLRLYRKHYRQKISPLSYYPTVGIIAVVGFLRSLGLGIRQMISGRG